MQAAVRFWDARAAAGKMVETCRIVASEGNPPPLSPPPPSPPPLCPSITAALRPPSSHTGAVACAWTPEERRTLLLWTALLPVAVKNFLRASAQRCDRRQELLPVVSEAVADELLGEAFGPIFVLNRMRAAAYRACSAPLPTERAWAAAAPPPPEVRAMAYRGLSDAINTLTGAWGAMERINGTPLPFVYVVHLRSVLVLYLLVAPLPAVAEGGWAVVPPLIAISWALLGIEAAALECERPFKHRPNHLPLGRFCVVTAENVAQTLADASAHLGV